MGKVETHVDPTTLSPAIPTHNPYCAYWVCLYGKKVFSPMGERVCGGSLLVSPPFRTLFLSCFVLPYLSGLCLYPGTDLCHELIGSYLLVYPGLMSFLWAH